MNKFKVTFYAGRAVNADAVTLLNVQIPPATQNIVYEGCRPSMEELMFACF